MMIIERAYWTERRTALGEEMRIRRHEEGKGQRKVKARGRRGK